MSGWDNIRPAEPVVERNVFLFFAWNHAPTPPAVATPKPTPVAAPKPAPVARKPSPAPADPAMESPVLDLYGVQIAGADKIWWIRNDRGQAKLTHNEARLARILLRAAPQRVAPSFIIKALGFPSGIADMAFSGVMVSLGPRIAPLGLTLVLDAYGAAMAIPGVDK